MKTIAFLLALSLGISGCTTHSGAITAGSIPRYPSGHINVYNGTPGTVERVTPIYYQREANGWIIAAGSALGALAGSGMGKGRGRATASIVGGVAGGLLAESAQENIKRPALAVSVVLDSGHRRIYQLPTSSAHFQPGMRVMTMSGDSQFLVPISQ